VAAARNYGAAGTSAEYLAFIDADDLWAPNKIEMQVKTLIQEGKRVGLVYCWFALIDSSDRVLSLKHQPNAEGWVLRELLQTNVVGNGSSALMRRTAFERVGGFDVTLRDGSEDIAMYLRIAEHYEFRVIKRYLVGYRMLPDNMSSDFIRMAHSCDTVLSEYRQRYPKYAEDIEKHINERRFWLLVRAASNTFTKACYELLLEMWKSNPRFILCNLPKLAALVCRARVSEIAKWALRSLSPGLDFRIRYLEKSW
jgi:glycosyltransferase involved in cell wall biosynthesis